MSENCGASGSVALVTGAGRGISSRKMTSKIAVQDNHYENN
jgi:hypothetical protein